MALGRRLNRVIKDLAPFRILLCHLPYVDPPLLCGLKMAAPALIILS